MLSIEAYVLKCTMRTRFRTEESLVFDLSFKIGPAVSQVGWTRKRGRGVMHWPN